MQTGPHNAITDVPGVLVGHTTLIRDAPRIARTGVTVIVPRADSIWHDQAAAGAFSFNGNGEMTGLAWIDETGMLDGPIGITNTSDVGQVRDAIVADAVERRGTEGWLLPVAAETWDGFLSDINAFHVSRADVFAALDAAGSGRVAEGNVGGGTGMICHGFKGGIGTASRLAPSRNGSYTVGALVQANYGSRRDLRVDGVPVGREIGPDHTPLPADPPSVDGSIIVIVATDAPLMPDQCRRLARRATVGLARVGGLGHNGSGDIFLAFATGNHFPHEVEGLYELRMLPHNQIDVLFEATAEAVEEAILNALCAAETLTGFRGRTAHALPHDQLQAVMRKYQRP
jgi:D-aminopeptidase